MGSPTGGDKGAGTINVAGDIYKNNTAYTNPDYVFDQYYDGKNDAGYAGIPSLVELEAFLKKHRHLPGISREASGIFSRLDVLLEKVEETILYLLELEKRIQVLENEGAGWERRIAKHAVAATG